MRSRIPTLAFLSVLSLAACAAPPVGDTPPGDGFQPPDTEIQPTNPQQHTMVYAGRYQITSIIDAAGANMFGDTISGTLVQLSQFHENPAGTILNLMAIYQVPYYTQVWNVLPGFIKNEFESLLNEYLFKNLFNAVPAIDQAVQVVDDIASVSRNVQLISEMVLTGPTGAGQLRGTHTIKALGFTLWTNHVEIPIPAALAALVQLDVRAVLTPLTAPGGPQASLAFNKQDFSIPYGNMIMDAISKLVFQPAGTTDLSGYLNHLIDCAGAGNWLANQCILGACLGDLVSASSLTNVCTGGLDLIGFLVESSVRGLKFDIVDLNNGKCVMYDKGYGDTTGDWKISAISDGSWDTTITIGGQSKMVKAPFDGHRVADQ